MGVEDKIPSGIALTTLEAVAGQMLHRSMWPATFGLACCAIEMMASGGPDFDIARYGMERFSATPRQADLMIVAGRCSQKFAPVVRQVWDQMPEPKWCIAMGAAAADAVQRHPYAARLRQGLAPGRQPRGGGPGRGAGRHGGDPAPPAEGSAGMTDDKLPAEAQGEAARRLPVDGGSLRPVEMGRRHGMFGGSRGGDTSGYGGLVSPVLFPGQSDRPYGSYFDHVADTLEKALLGGSASFAEAIDAVVIDRGEMTLHVRRQHLAAVAQALRDHPGLRFEMCTGVSGVHYPQVEGAELHAVYHLLSLTHGSTTTRR